MQILGYSIDVEIIVKFIYLMRFHYHINTLIVFLYVSYVSRYCIQLYPSCIFMSCVGYQNTKERIRVNG